MAVVPPCQGDVWWVALDPVVGSEVAKTRPALIVSVDEINHAPARLCIVAPITTTPRESAVRIELPRKQGSVRVGYVEPYQIRTVSHDRLTRRIDMADVTVKREVAHRIELFTRHRP
ncbi:MAG: type II toxin-antitoxin system PemK/MazF family toxin [Solirubrobacteraceae bacterium]